MAYVSTPTTMPSLMLPTIAMTRMVRTDGIDSTGLWKLIWRTAVNIFTDTMSRMAPVTDAGMARKTGEKRSASRKQTAATIGVTPVRPPSATPAALSR